MSWLASLVLRVFHLVYSFITSVCAYYVSFTRPTPGSLLAPRHRIPNHIVLLLVVDNDTPDSETIGCCIQSVRNAATWAKAAGVKRLTVYDREGILTSEFRDLQQTLDLQDPNSSVTGECDSSDSELEYPLTPPLSDEGDATPHSRSGDDLTRQHLGVVTLRFPTIQQPKVTSVKRRRTKGVKEATQESSFLLHLLSPASSKAAIAAVARSILRYTNGTKGQRDKLSLSIEDINRVLEGPHGFPSPDLMLVHYVTTPRQSPIPLELYGFPPWQIRLTEIFHERLRLTRRTLLSPLKSRDTYASELTELEFRTALDEYALAQMRFGK